MCTPLPRPMIGCSSGCCRSRARAAADRGLLQTAGWWHRLTYLVLWGGGYGDALIPLDCDPRDADVKAGHLLAVARGAHPAVPSVLRSPSSGQGQATVASSRSQARCPAAQRSAGPRGQLRRAQPATPCPQARSSAGCRALCTGLWTHLVHAVGCQAPPGRPAAHDLGARLQDRAAVIVCRVGWSGLGPVRPAGACGRINPGPHCSVLYERLRHSKAYPARKTYARRPSPSCLPWRWPAGPR